MKEIVRVIVTRLSDGESLALATLLARRGSGPRATGTRMVVCAGGAALGTVGGGLLEAQVRDEAARLSRERPATVLWAPVHSLRADGTGAVSDGQVEVLIEWLDAASEEQVSVWRGLWAALKARRRAWLLTVLPGSRSAEEPVVHYLVGGDGSSLGALPAGLGRDLPAGLCGDTRGAAGGQIDLAKVRQPVVVPAGSRRLLIEPVYAPGRVIVFGAGHVSQRLVPLCDLVGFETTVVDDRAEYASRQLFGAASQIVLIESYDDATHGLEVDRDSYLVIATRGHEQDLAVLEQALRTGACYIGMLGSLAKRESFSRTLAGRGFTAQDLARIHSPVGLKIGAETPEEIAISIVAELIEVRARRHGSAAAPSA